MRFLSRFVIFPAFLGLGATLNSLFYLIVHSLGVIEGDGSLSVGHFDRRAAASAPFAMSCPD